VNGGLNRAGKRLNDHSAAGKALADLAFGQACDPPNSVICENMPLRVFRAGGQAKWYAIGVLNEALP
jgi:hypothetical protein